LSSTEPKPDRFRPDRFTWEPDDLDDEVNDRLAQDLPPQSDKPDKSS
jgi:hypothetical protein